MILTKIMSAIGLAAPLRPDDHALRTAIRHARAASWQHGKLSAREQTASLDRIEQHVTDTRGVEGIKSAGDLKDTIRDMLGKLP